MPANLTLSLPHHPAENSVTRLFRTLVLAHHRQSQRHRLARLDPHLLRDIGLDAETVARECAKPFWRG
ncbi:MAG: hypothetical protein B7Z31_01045 [Rhodobacterales bacterium 12-65-15]|nr:MAG: hypothetical protein B7Z31_01045 [Rhodobacterales bacterium 12-65-15]